MSNKYVPPVEPRFGFFALPTAEEVRENDKQILKKASRPIRVDELEKIEKEHKVIYNYFSAVYRDARNLITDKGFKKYPDLVIECMLKDIEQDIRDSLQHLEFDYKKDRKDDL